ncbi:hypothetical protein KHQ84_gp049 [Rhodococcus phage Finch]|uniref:Minor tail protein n=1 Tax=Rhodococcus phage Finch TaxID=2094144 RepID=A0A2P1JXC2_9CAUD|nr:hypothetical protein KHQ84_gp049 [Rhodococcus phage Finch]AVO24989.1 hypothetical protein SEA_FINCH_49 [Rhodococcus phage Finch]
MGVASISHNGKVFRFRTDPNKIRWNYRVNTNVTNTYGGRVVQLLSISIDDLTVAADAGGGGWAYLKSAAEFFRDMLFDQKNGGSPGVFSYPPRGWEMGVYAQGFPFKDGWNDVAREFTMQFKVQEDISGIITSDTLEVEIAKLKQGVGWKHNEYNTPPAPETPEAEPAPDAGTPQNPSQGPAPSPNNPALPNIGGR